ncbi:hypothetical protein CONPUDRAFT_123770 [Coniophora puteana RWD-64-598 SS2]|uniref:Terpenoid synthase n=1 Tax=Coniophora puteana (strain RWD-64-598) TaxID=741705 RepID=A0A5M3MPB4_CONPW|nr:uncharacterized protein CONPUDRAFT_123770 [Coniophora puteana RWD-64-598 SS2]EIW80953.1 hypothetical protein CONPUDRAFT_123770 [Coniophora puteana RWD-64-598 SS2]
MIFTRRVPQRVAAELSRSVARPSRLAYSRKRTVATAASGSANPRQYCEEYVQKHDYEGYLTSKFYPRHRQSGYYALRAFYIELASVQESVSNAVLGQMRMQFWRDAVKDSANGKPPRHPVALALHDNITSLKSAPYHLKRIIDARDNELQNPTHLTMDSLTSHAESTASTLLYLLLSQFSLTSHDLSHAASHVGIASSLATLLRALPFHISKGQMVIPAEITAKHGVSQEEVFRTRKSSPKLEDAVFEFATIANDHLLTAREMFKETGGKVPAEAMPIFLTAVPAASYLKRLEVANFDAFHPSLKVRDWKLPWHVWRSYYKRTF